MSLRSWVRISRIPFTTAVIVPSVLGGLIAWRDGSLHVGYFLLTVLGAVCANLGLNFSNDYFDYLSGADEGNQELTPFSGGSRAIQEGIISPRGVLMWSLAFYAVTVVIGLYLAAMRGWLLLAIGFLGLFLAFFHNAPPIRLYYIAPALGDLSVGIGCGPLIVLGAYYVQAQRLSVEALWASLPVGFLISAVLYANEFPDTVSDRAVGKKTIQALFGRKSAVGGYVALIVLAYAAIVTGALLGVLPWVLLLALVTLPLAIRAIRGMIMYYGETPKLIPTLATTVLVHLSTGILLIVGYVLQVVLAI
jgi:1,4-dihydroxy-2-naphthoate octaprenyltransferase